MEIFTQLHQCYLHKYMGESSLIHALTCRNNYMARHTRVVVTLQGIVGFQLMFV